MDLQSFGVGGRTVQRALTTDDFHRQQFNYNEYASKHSDQVFLSCSLKHGDNAESFSDVQFRLAGHPEMPEAGSVARIQDRVIPEYSDFDYDSSLSIVQQMEEAKMGQDAIWEEERTSKNAESFIGNRRFLQVFRKVS